MDPRVSVHCPCIRRHVWVSAVRKFQRDLQGSAAAKAGVLLDSSGRYEPFDTCADNDANCRRRLHLKTGVADGEDLCTAVWIGGETALYQRPLGRHSTRRND